MREYAFEYLDKSLLIKTLCISFGLFLIVETLILAYATNDTLLVLGVVVGFALPLVYFIANERKIKKTGIMLIGYERIVFGVFNKTKIIEVPEVARYQVSHDNGITLTLVLKGGNTFRIAANNNFCDSTKLKQACHGIEEAIWNLIWTTTEN